MNFRLCVAHALALATLCACGGGGVGGGGTSLPVAPTIAPTASPTPASVTLNHVTPSTTESGTSASYDAPHYFSTPGGTSNGKLFVFLPGTGGVPSSVQDILREGAARGYYVIGLDYVNGTEVDTYCQGSSDPSCWGNVRSELVYGNGTTNLVTVAPADAIVGRLTALLAYLQATYPSQNWGQFVNGGSPSWSRIVVGGHSQGAGNAAYIAKANVLAGVCMFDSPDDGNASAGAASWLSQPNATPTATMYGFTNMDDAIAGFNGVTQNWSLIGVPGAPYDIDTSAPPYGSNHQLYTVAPTSVTPNTHGYTVVDAATPISNGVPTFAPVWDAACFDS